MHSESSAEQVNQQFTADVARLKERLTFYESFDRLIQENVSQASQLLREAIDLKEAAAHEADHAKTRLQDERNRDREHYRALFSTMLDEITALQGQAERLARRLTEAIDVLESQLPPGAEFPSLTNTLIPELAAGLDISQDPIAQFEDEAPSSTLDEAVLIESDEPAALASGSETERPTLPADLHGAAAPVEYHLNQQEALNLARDRDDSHDTAQSVPTAAVDERLAEDSIVPPGGAIDDALTGQEVVLDTAEVRSASFVLLMHGVPRAATALSLKQYLEGLDHVQKVEPREFASGVLRLQLHVSRDLSVSDLRDWPGGNQLAAIHTRSGLLEIQMH